MKLRIALLAILCLTLASIPAWAQWSYDNGPINGTTDAWTINFGYIVSDTYIAGGNSVTNFSFGVWEFPGRRPDSRSFREHGGWQERVRTVVDEKTIVRGLWSPK